MRKVLCLCFASVLTNISFAQNFLQTQSHWHRDWNYFLCPAAGYDHHMHVGDTLIQGKVFSKIEHKQMVVYVHPSYPNGYISIADRKPVFLRQSHDTLYLFDDEYLEERFGWTQNPIPGNLYYLGKARNLAAQTDVKIYSRVDSVRTEEIQGQQTKWINSTPNLDSLGNEITFFTEKFEYVRKLNTLLGPVTEWFSTSLTRLSCYQSYETFQLNYSSSDCLGGTGLSCENITGMKSNAVLKGSNIVAQNPLSGEVLIRNSAGKEVRILDLQGRQLFAGMLEKDLEVLNLNNLQLGVFLLFVEGRFVERINKF